MIRISRTIHPRAAMPAPAEVSLKDPKDFRYIGKPLPRKDSKAKTNGSARFTIDVTLPGMLTAVVAHPPHFGATVRSFDATKTKTLKGVVDVVQIPQGVAVLATDFWTAKQGRDALVVSWDETHANRLAQQKSSRNTRRLQKGPD